MVTRRDSGEYPAMVMRMGSREYPTEVKMEYPTATEMRMSREDLAAVTRRDFEYPVTDEVSLRDDDECVKGAPRRGGDEMVFGVSHRNSDEGTEGGLRHNGDDKVEEEIQWGHIEGVWGPRRVDGDHGSDAFG